MCRLLSSIVQSSCCFFIHLHKFVCSCHGLFTCSQATCMMPRWPWAFILLVLAWCWIWYVLRVICHYKLLQIHVTLRSNLFLVSVYEIPMLVYYFKGGTYIWERCWSGIDGWGTCFIGMSSLVVFLSQFSKKNLLLLWYLYIPLAN